MIAKWNKKNITILTRIYSSMLWDDILSYFPELTIDQIKRKAGKLKLKRDYTVNSGGRGKDSYEYSETEIEFIKNNYENIKYEDIAKYLGRGLSSVSNKINQLGLKKIEKWTQEEINLLISVYPKYDMDYLIKNYFPNKTKRCVYKKANAIGMAKESSVIKLNPSYTKEYCIFKLVELSNILGRTPIHSELVKNGLPSLPTYRVLFGNYTNACDEAGLIPNFSKIGLGRKSVLKSKKGDNCYSVYEEIITNFFIDNNIEYIKEDRYSKYISDKECKTKRVDWVLCDNTFVEYWGFPTDERYKKQMDLKISICNRNKINLISIYVEDINCLGKIFEKYISQNP